MSGRSVGPTRSPGRGRSGSAAQRAAVRGRGSWHHGATEPRRLMQTVKGLSTDIPICVNLPFSGEYACCWFRQMLAAVKCDCKKLVLQYFWVRSSPSHPAAHRGVDVIRCQQRGSASPVAPVPACVSVASLGGEALGCPRHTDFIPPIPPQTSAGLEHRKHRGHRL